MAKKKSGAKAPKKTPKKRVKRTPMRPRGSQAMQMQVALPEDGVSMKVTDRNGKAIATLLLHPDGLQMTAGRNRSFQSSMLAWPKLQTLSQAGLF